MIHVEETTYKLARYCEGRDFSGYDPYDALNSPFIKVLSFRQKYGRIAWIQFLRRLPMNMRPLLLVKKGHNPKGLGLLLWGYADLSRSEPGNFELQINRILDLIEHNRSNCTGNGWGYNFDWQSKAFFVPKFTPTIVNSSFIGHSLLDTWEVTGSQRALDLAVPIKDFILNDINRTFDGLIFCFSYTPIDNLVVHNANLLGASLLIRLFKITGDESLKSTALSSLAWSMDRQSNDGSWPFADTNYQQWIDSFHTGFNLQSIRYFIQLGEGEECRSSYEKGIKFYAENFFLNDGTPKYYHNSIYPIDIHSPAQAIAFFSSEDEYSKLADKVCRWMVDNLFNSELGYFSFRKGQHFTNKIPYMRWGQAWAFHALAAYVASQRANLTGPKGEFL